MSPGPWRYRYIVRDPGGQICGWMIEAGDPVIWDPCCPDFTGPVVLSVFERAKWVWIEEFEPQQHRKPAITEMRTGLSIHVGGRQRPHL